MNIFPTMISIAIAFVATLSAGAFAPKYKRNLGILAAFTAGVLIALSLFDMLPEILMLIPTVQGSVGAALLTLASGFIFLLAVDRLLFQPSKNAKTSKKRFSPKAGVVATAEFCSHGFLEGLAIGVSFQFDWHLGLVVAVAVISHDFCDGLSTVTIMLNSGNTMKASLSMLFVDAIAPVLGGITTFFFHLQDYYTIFFQSFLAGGFIYLGTGKLLPLAREKNPTLTTAIFLIAGFILILFISRMINT
jgi:zinc transporter ZupT